MKFNLKSNFNNAVQNLRNAYDLSIEEEMKKIQYLSLGAVVIVLFFFVFAPENVNALLLIFVILLGAFLALYFLDDWIYRRQLIVGLFVLAFFMQFNNQRYASSSISEAEDKRNNTSYSLKNQTVIAIGASYQIEGAIQYAEQVRAKGIEQVKVLYIQNTFNTIIDTNAISPQIRVIQPQAYPLNVSKAKFLDKRGEIEIYKSE